MRRFIFLLFGIFVVYALWLGQRLYWRGDDAAVAVSISIEQGASFASVTQLLIEKGVLPRRDAWLLRFYAERKDLDTKLAVGTVETRLGGSIAHIAQAITNRPRETKQLTIIEGWDLHDLLDYLEREDIKGAENLFDYTGVPGRDYREDRGQPTKYIAADIPLLKHKPWYVSMEGYLFPDTYEVYATATVEDVLTKMLERMDYLFNEGTRNLCAFHDMTVHECLTLASIAEGEVRSRDDRRKVVDIMLRRRAENWALQVDSSVNYITREKRPGITLKQKEIDSVYNTYKYPGFPLGPIGMPSELSLEAAINPWGNEYNYFLTDPEGAVHYAVTLEQHNENKTRFLR